MAHHHSPEFLALVDAARAVVREISIPDYQAREDAGDGMILIDVREDHEWEKGRIPGAMHMSRGIIERDIERTFADKNAPLVLYCGGGYRSALAADNLQKMGYVNVQSLAGGFREWTHEGLPVEK